MEFALQHNGKGGKYHLIDENSNILCGTECMLDFTAMEKVDKNLKEDLTSFTMEEKDFCKSCLVRLRIRKLEFEFGSLWKAYQSTAINYPTYYRLRNIAIG